MYYRYITYRSYVTMIIIVIYNNIIILLLLHTLIQNTIFLEVQIECDFAELCIQ